MRHSSSSCLSAGERGEERYLTNSENPESIAKKVRLYKLNEQRGETTEQKRFFQKNLQKSIKIRKSEEDKCFRRNFMAR
jgi:hypothetical protein